MILPTGGMPDPDSPQPPPHSATTGTDAVATLLLALRDACGQGLAAMRSLSGAAPGDTAGTEDLLAAAIRLMSGAGSGQAAAAGGDTRGAADQAGILATAALQAAAAASASTFRYWQGLAEIGARHQALVLQGMADRPPQPRARMTAGPAMAAAFRAALREVGDVAMLEARRVQRDLDEIGVAAAEAAAGHGAEAAEAAFRRRWKAKE